MSSIRYREESPGFGSVLGGMAAGALAGFAVGLVVAQRVGGISGLRSRFNTRLRAIDDRLHGGDAEVADYEVDELDDGEDQAATELEERVLDAYRNDPVLCERAIDIGALGDGIIELTGWVYTDGEREHAVTIAGGVPGVQTVVNKLDVGDDEEFLSETDELDDDILPELDEVRAEAATEVVDVDRITTKRKRSKRGGKASLSAEPDLPSDDLSLAD